jgi:hypothetical protein
VLKGSKSPGKQRFLAILVLLFLLLPWFEAARTSGAEPNRKPKQISFATNPVSIAKHANCFDLFDFGARGIGLAYAVSTALKYWKSGCNCCDFATNCYASTGFR